MALGGQGGRLLHRAGKEDLVADEVVGRHDQHLCLRAVALGYLQRGQGNGRRRVAAKGLQQEGGRFGLLWQCQLEFVPRQEEVLAVGDGEDLARFGHTAGAPVRLEQQALAVGQLHERFGVPLARDGPEPGAGTAGQNDRDQHGG